MAYCCVTTCLCRCDEPLRYRSHNPSDESVRSWVEYLQTKGIERVCCLLDRKLDRYDALLEQYRQSSGTDSVRRAPIPDHEAVSEGTLTREILPFLEEGVEADAPVVVHYSAGQGRTGHILAFWLATNRGYALDDAIETVRQTGRSPLEAAPRSELQTLLDACR
ncbi:MAG: hypothetical protein J07HX64_01242 [halophilic archaeon J07HX64]|jgi:Predicted protein-tyrosine phosphatase|nr:MAG: hypothetical protein J07HX64_01242 [halophilic archaeon J07HX64]